MTWPLGRRFLVRSLATICLPAIFSSMAARMRFFSSSSNASGRRCPAIWSMSCSASFSSAGETVDRLDVEILQRAHFVGEEQLLEDQAVFGWPYLHHVLLGLPRPLASAQRPLPASPAAAGCTVCRRACRARGSTPCRRRAGRPTSPGRRRQCRSVARASSSAFSSSGEDHKLILFEFVAFHHSARATTARPLGYVLLLDRPPSLSAC